MQAMFDTESPSIRARVRRADFLSTPNLAHLGCRSTKFGGLVGLALNVDLYLVDVSGNGQSQCFVEVFLRRSLYIFMISG